MTSLVYERDGIQLYHGDCLDFMSGMQDAPDLVFTSPPYNKGRRLDGNWSGVPTASSKGSRFRDGYGVTGDCMEPAAYEDWQRTVLRTCWERLSDDGAIFYNHKPRIQNGELWTPLSLNPDLPLRQIVVWDRGGGVNLMPGAFMPASEWLLLFAKRSFRLLTKGHSAIGDVWRIPHERKVAHPAPFPVALPERAISATGAALVFDPFCGSGSTLIAAKRRGRRAIGVEVNRDYCDLAIQRLSES